MKTNFIGKDSIKNLDKIIKETSSSRIFLVTGRDSYKSSGAEKTLRPYLKNKDVYRFFDFNVNPSLDQIDNGVRKIKAFNPDILIAIGGGSVIDMAKLINISAAQNIDSIEKVILEKETINRKGIKLLAIPTTAGSGSEVTQFAAVYIANTKYSVDHSFLLPDFYIVDPIFLFNLPKYILACSGFDALSQATESYWSVRSSSQSKNYAEQSIKMILKSIKNAVNDKNIDAIETMSRASNLAGKAINITRTTAPHAISYPITKYFGIPHGHSVALNVGKFFIINSLTDPEKIIDPRGRDYLSNTMKELIKTFGCRDANDCSEKWYKLMEELSLEADLIKLGIKNHSDIEKIVKNVNLQRLSNNPIAIDEDILYKILA